MELFIELIFRGFIMGVLGLNARYFFFRIIGKNINKSDLISGRKKKQDDWYQDFLNALVGLLIICLLAIGFAYIGGAWGR